jgi:hypothetical protein
MTLAVHALALAAVLLPVPGTSDFNGDGLADVAQGANAAGFTQQVKPPWWEYVVFGKNDGAFVDVRAPGTHGAIVHGPYSNYGNAPSAGERQRRLGGQRGNNGFAPISSRRHPRGEKPAL